MKAKKIVALVAAAAMMLSMAACGSTDNSSSDAKDGRYRYRDRTGNC